MATNNATLQAYLNFLNGTTGASASIQFPLTSFLVNGNHFADGAFSVPITAGGTALPLGGVAPGGLFLIVNTDPANYIQVLNAVNGTVLLRVGPGEPAIGRFDPSVVAPAVLAAGAPVVIQYLLIDP